MNTPPVQSDSIPTVLSPIAFAYQAVMSGDFAPPDRMSYAGPSTLNAQTSATDVPTPSMANAVVRPSPTVASVPTATTASLRAAVNAVQLTGAINTANQPAGLTWPFDHTAAQLADYLFKRHDESLGSLHAGLRTPSSPSFGVYQSTVEELALLYSTAGEQRLATAILQMLEAAEGIPSRRQNPVMKTIKALAQASLERPQR